MDPLALKLRPTKLKDVIGQTHLVSKDKVLYNLIKNKKIFSMILYGKPGIGKTTLANVIVNELGLKYRMLNAVINSKKDIDIVIEEAKMYNGIVLIMDEIHRLNKDKQDILLPHLESGLITLIGLTSSNPYHKINPAIRSRCQIYELKELTKDDIILGLKKACKSEFLPNIKIDKKCLDIIATMSSGDLRYAYNLLEVCYYSTSDFNITLDVINNTISKPVNFIDANDDGYYDTISALQKSIRGSDVNASLYYAAVLINAEELDILFRRLSVIAYEDIGLANPSIGPKVDAMINACERLGLPEAVIPIGTVIIEMALSPKSNSGEESINAALNDVRNGIVGPVPNHIKTNSPDYKYPHNYKNAYIYQQYLPDKLKDKEYYKYKTTSSYEKQLVDIYNKLKELNKKNES